MIKRLAMLTVTMLLATGAGACTKISGTVYDAVTRRPVSGAVFTVGHPNGLGASEKKYTDSNGHFEFNVVSLDENHLYVYDGKEPASAQRIDRMELGPRMKLYIHKGPGD